ncbi:DUF7007 domain-containing protein [Paraoerskovia marina]|uniref:DUF7007 domain-containing protein n=1 Tax=Paraoerskovia marina TaxID=545619 RepID=UPI0012DF2528|nr:hypothetical protein [Paraoerskovia marina]
MARPGGQGWNTTSVQPRKPAGTATGGRFDTGAGGATFTHLGPTTVQAREVREAVEAADHARAVEVAAARPRRPPALPGPFDGAWGNVESMPGSRTPSGPATSVAELAPGIERVHAGQAEFVHLSVERNSQVGAAHRSTDGWYPAGPGVGAVKVAFPFEFAADRRASSMAGVPGGRDVFATSDAEVAAIRSECVEQMGGARD